jgi:rare lipoprotein A
LYLQIGAFTSWANAVTLRARLADAQLGPIKIYSELQGKIRIYRVRIGPIDSVEESDQLVQRAAARGISDAHIVIDTATDGDAESRRERAIE